MLHKILKGLAPVAAIAMAVSLSGCDGMNITIGDTDGVPLAKLDMSGNPPTEVVLAGPDRVEISDGAKLAIDVSGDQAAIDALRFSLKDGTLGIAREKNGWKDKGTATIRVTLPTPEKLVMAGSGAITAASLKGKASVTIAGSGEVRVARVAADSLEVALPGSGRFTGAGTAKSLDLTVAGSGAAEMAGLKVDTADITIAGSGTTAFASDGTVKANIIGSGNVTVTGRATCTVSAVGSGKIVCETVKQDADDK